jgi:perosamine synthetase
MSVGAATDRLDGFLRQGLGLSGRVALHEPWFNGNEEAYVQDCIRTGWVSSVGSYVDRFERDVAAASGTAHAVAIVNGTSALHVALLLAGVKPGDLVICPPLTFIGTANAISYCGADPIFVDIDPATLGLDPVGIGDLLRDQCRRDAGAMTHVPTGRRIGAILPVHIFGHPVDMDPLVALAAEFGLPVIEDACESIGSTYRNRPCGSLSPIGVISFNGNKVVTTGGGGAIVTNDADLARQAKHLTTTARRADSNNFIHDQVGFNYRLPNLNAALGCAQLESLADKIARKRLLAQTYAALFAGLAGVRFFRETPWARSNYWLNALLFDEPEARDTFLRDTKARDIETRPCWTLMCDMPMYETAPRAGALDQARACQARIANIPSSPQLTLNLEAPS